jgi:hypothetical protein
MVPEKSTAQTNAQPPMARMLLARAVLLSMLLFLAAWRSMS